MVIAWYVRDGSDARTHAVAQYVVAIPSPTVPLEAHDTGSWWRAADLALRELQQLEQRRARGEIDDTALAAARRDVVAGRR